VAPSPKPRKKPEPASVSKLRIGGRNAVVFSHPLDDSEQLLSRGEQQIALLLLCGFRAREIATLRETSARTVSKQIESIYRKLGVTTRAELALRYSLEAFGSRKTG
jgi:DNA-binding NarL/FixJ family response regulator